MFKKVLAVVMSAALAFAAVPAINADAAALKGLTGEFSLTTGDDAGWSNAAYWSGETTTVSAKDLTGTADVYVPAVAFDSVGNDGGFHVSLTATVWDETNKKNYEIPLCGVDFTGTSKGKNIAYWHYDEGTKSSMDNPSYASVKLVGDFYKVSLKDAPVDTAQTVHVWDEAAQKDDSSSLSAVPTSGGVGVVADVNAWGLSKAVSGKFFVANASVKSAGTTVFTPDTSSNENVGNTSNSKNESGTDIKISTLNTSFKPAKTKATVSAGKKATVKVTTQFSGDKVTVKTSKKAVATATYKSGKLTIKGVKTGKATITLKSNGVTKKIKVTVK